MKKHQKIEILTQTLLLGILNPRKSDAAPLEGRIGLRILDAGGYPKDYRAP
jgi:hypothetical protein